MEERISMPEDIQMRHRPKKPNTTNSLQKKENRGKQRKIKSMKNRDRRHRK